MLSPLKAPWASLFQNTGEEIVETWQWHSVGGAPGVQFYYN